MIEDEIAVAHMLANVLKVRIAVVSVGSVICSIPFDAVESWEIVLYVTI